MSWYKDRIKGLKALVLILAFVTFLPLTAGCQRIMDMQRWSACDSCLPAHVREQRGKNPARDAESKTDFYYFKPTSCNL